MNASWSYEQGVHWVRTEHAARLFALEPAFVEQLCSQGYLEEARRIGGELWLAEEMLDRLARIRYWHLHLGLELDLWAAWLR